MAAELPDRLRLAAGGGDAVHPAGRVRLGGDRGVRARRRRSRSSHGCRARCSCRPPRSPGSRSPCANADRCPVARRLARKGLAPSAAVTFMLAAPILNPVVVASTFVAYRGRDSLWVMVLGRMGLGFLVAVAVGWVVGNTRKEDLLKAAPRRRRRGRGGRTRMSRAGPGSSRHLSGDFFFMGRFLVMGAAIAAAVQTFVPQTIVVEGGQPAGAVAPGDDGARVPDVALLRVGRVRGGVVHAVRARGAARVPGVGADDRPEARSALRRHVQQGVRADGDGDRRRGDAWPGRCGCRWCSDDGASGDVAPERCTGARLVWRRAWCSARGRGCSGSCS